MEDYLKKREMRTVVEDEKSERREVKSGVPQGSVLAPIMFLIYVNDMKEVVSSYISLFADDAKLLKKRLETTRMWGAIESHKQDIWIESDVGNGI